MEKGYLYKSIVLLLVFVFIGCKQEPEQQLRRSEIPVPRLDPANRELGQLKREIEHQLNKSYALENRIREYINNNGVGKVEDAQKMLVDLNEIIISVSYQRERVEDIINKFDTIASRITYSRVKGDYRVPPGGIHLAPDCDSPDGIHILEIDGDWITNDSVNVARCRVIAHGNFVYKGKILKNEEDYSYLVNKQCDKSDFKIIGK